MSTISDSAAKIMVQLTMCGIAPFATNVMVGPFPDAFSVWGGKNAYLMVENNEQRRLEMARKRQARNLGVCGAGNHITWHKMTAVSDVNLWCLYRTDFDNLLVKHPQISSALSQ